MIRSFGHSDAVDKGVTPANVMVFLGLTLDVTDEVIYLTQAKAESYSALLQEVVSGAAGVLASNSVFAAVDPVNSLVHKLLHACSVVVLGRQHLFHCLRALRTTADLRAGRMVLVAAAVLKELRWWEAALASAPSTGVPLASRCRFPDASADGAIVPYSHASSELDSPESSGFGAWAIVDGVVVYVHGRWLPWELQQLSINVTELAAMQFGTFTFISFAQSCGLSVSHVPEFTDNTAAEHSADRGWPHSERMHAFVSDRLHRLQSLGVYSVAERVASVDNDVADGLS